MNLRNTDQNYGAIAKWLHWSTAILFLGAYVSVYYRHWFTHEDTPESWIILQLHLSIGISIAGIVALRIIWRLTNPPPQPEPDHKIVHLMAEFGHLALYGVMILMPLTGYLGTYVTTEFFFLFDIPSFGDTLIFHSAIEEGLGIPFEEFEKPLDFLHKKVFGSWLTWMLILGHAGAALHHHFIKKDRTLIKMTTGK